MKQAFRAFTLATSLISFGFVSASQAQQSNVSYPSATKVALKCDQYFKTRANEIARALKDCGKTRKSEALPAAPDCRVDDLSENDLNPIIRRSVQATVATGRDRGIGNLTARTHVFSEKAEQFFSRCRNVTDSLRQRREERGAIEQAKRQEHARSAH